MSQELPRSRQQANALMALDTGFGEGAYSSSYLNKIGSAAYLDTTVQFGVSGKLKPLESTVNSDNGLRTTKDFVEAAASRQKVSATGTGR